MVKEFSGSIWKQDSDQKITSVLFIYVLQLHPLELQIRAERLREQYQMHRLKQACFKVAFNSYLFGAGCS